MEIHIPPPSLLLLLFLHGCPFLTMFDLLKKKGEREEVPMDANFDQSEEEEEEGGVTYCAKGGREGGGRESGSAERRRGKEKREQYEREN